MTDLALTTAIKQKIVELKQKYPTEDLLPDNGFYRYLYQPGEQHGDQRQTASGPRTPLG